MHAQLQSCVSGSLNVQRTACHGRNMEYSSQCLLPEASSLLLIVFAKRGLTGNWTVLNWNGSSLSDGINGILGVMITSPANGPWEILASMRLGEPFVMIHLVPFISLGGSNDCKRMIGHPFFNMSIYSGRLESLTEFRNSVGKWSASSAVIAESIDL